MMIGRLLSGAAVLTVLTGLLMRLQPTARGSPEAAFLLPVAAVGLLLCGATLLLATYSPRLVSTTQLLATLTLVLSATAFAVSLVGQPNVSLWPGTAFSLTLIAAALLLISLNRYFSTAQVLLHVAGLLALVRLIGLAFGVDHSLMGAPYSLSATLASATIVLLWIGGLCALSPRGAVGTLLGDLVGSRVARLLLPTAVLLPLITTWLRLRWESLGLLSTAEGAMLAAVVNSAVLALVILWAASLLNRATEDQARQASELQRSEALLRGVFESPMIGIFYWDLQGRITDANHKFIEMLGYDREAVKSGRLSWDQLTPPEFAEQETAKQKEVATLHQIAPYEKEFYRADGSRQPVLIGAVMLDTALKSGVAFAIDISEQQQTSRELLTRNRELEAANAELDSFSYSVSHDLRAPLRSIEGFSKALEEDYGAQLDDDGRHFLQRVRVGTLRMAQLIDDLLSLSRVGRADLLRKPVDLTALTESVLAQFREAEPERVVAASIQPGLLVDGDARLLRIVMENLIGNAWKFSAGKPEASIEVGSERTDRGESFYVRDNGAGFNMTYAAKLFTAFQRLHRADEFAGTGIGLAIVRRIVTRHGGETWAEATVGAGAKFSFTLAPRREEC